MIGITTSYHLYTIYFFGFNPLEYMKIWYGITLITSALSYICWYAKGTSKVSIIISSFILCVMFMSSFSIGIMNFGMYVNYKKYWNIKIGEIFKK